MRSTGPLTDKTVLYTTPETRGNVFTYNAKAHPELGDGHTLLVTYNVNSFDTADVYTERRQLPSAVRRCESGHRGIGRPLRAERSLKR